MNRIVFVGGLAVMAYGLFLYAFNFSNPTGGTGFVYNGPVHPVWPIDIVVVGLLLIGFSLLFKKQEKPAQHGDPPDFR